MKSAVGVKQIRHPVVAFPPGNMALQENAAEIADVKANACESFVC